MVQATEQFIISTTFLSSGAHLLRLVQSCMHVIRYDYVYRFPVQPRLYPVLVLLLLPTVRSNIVSSGQTDSMRKQRLNFKELITLACR